MSSKKVRARKLKGFQDYTPEVMAVRQHVMQVVQKHAALGGYELIGTPALEYAEVLLGVGGETDKQVYKFLDNGDREVALRFDLTVPFARYIGENHGKMLFPFKRAQIGDVWRAEKPQKGRYREFCQCDLDIIGVDSPQADLDIIYSLSSILNEILPSGFTVAIGQRRILTKLLKEVLGVTKIEDEYQALIILDKLAKIGLEKTTAMLVEELGVQVEEAQQLLKLISPDPDTKQTNMDPVAEFFQAPEDRAVFDGFIATCSNLAQMTQGSKAQILIDLSIARGLGYYTGIVFETTIDALPGFGSVSSGGRYNDLAQRFIDRELPGVGGSVGLDRLTAALAELDFSPGVDKTQVFIAPLDEKSADYSNKLMAMLRTEGVAAFCNLKPQKIAAQFKFASKKNYTHVIALGEQEKNSNHYNIKNMATGEELKGVSFKELVDSIK